MKGILVYIDDQPRIRTPQGDYELPSVDLPNHTPIHYDEETKQITKTGTPPTKEIPDFKDATPKTKHEHRFAYLRTKPQRRIFRVQSTIVQETHRYYAETGAEHVFTPCILGTASESGSNVFPVYYYGKHAYLRQDPQLHRQLSIISGAHKIYEIGPAWRAEKSHTSRHLSEHRVIAVEHGHIVSMQEPIKDAVHLLKHLTTTLQQRGLIDTQKIPEKPPTYTFQEAKKICAEHGENLEKDLSGTAEKILYEKTKEESDVVIVTHFPDKTKPFYVMRGDKHTESFDIIYKGIEISSGGQREHRHRELLRSVEKHGMDPKTISWFTDAFTYGAPAHGGFAIGIERLTALLTDTDTVKDTTYFPRDPKKLVP